MAQYRHGFAVRDTASEMSTVMCWAASETSACLCGPASIEAREDDSRGASQFR